MLARAQQVAQTVAQQAQSAISAGVEAAKDLGGGLVGGGGR
jgi:hypothetical protein